MTQIGNHDDAYRSTPLEQKLAWFQNAPGLSAVEPARQFMSGAAALYTDSDAQVRATMRKLGADWTGEAATNAGATLQRAAQWGQDASAGHATAGETVEGYGRSFESVRGQIHWDDPWAWGWNDTATAAASVATLSPAPFLGNITADYFTTAQKNRTNDATAIAALQTHEKQTRTAVGSFPNIPPAGPGPHSGKPSVVGRPPTPPPTKAGAGDGASAGGGAGVGALPVGGGLPGSVIAAAGGASADGAGAGGVGAGGIGAGGASPGGSAGGSGPAGGGGGTGLGGSIPGGVVPGPIGVGAGGQPGQPGGGARPGGSAGGAAGADPRLRGGDAPAGVVGRDGGPLRSPTGAPTSGDGAGRFGVGAGGGAPGGAASAVGGGAGGAAGGSAGGAAGTVGGAAGGSAGGAAGAVGGAAGGSAGGAAGAVGGGAGGAAGGWREVVGRGPSEPGLISRGPAAGAEFAARLPSGAAIGGAGAEGAGMPFIGGMGVGAGAQSTEHRTTYWVRSAEPFDVPLPRHSEGVIHGGGA